MTVKKKANTTEVELLDEYAKLSSIISGCSVIEFKDRKATVHTDTVAKIKMYIKAAD